MTVEVTTITITINNKQKKKGEKDKREPKSTNSLRKTLTHVVCRVLRETQVWFILTLERRNEDCVASLTCTG